EEGTCIARIVRFPSTLYRSHKWHTWLPRRAFAALRLPHEARRDRADPSGQEVEPPLIREPDGPEERSTLKGRGEIL
ncbi:hypothetical protein LZ189_17715, partial [Rhodovulum sulfidophilum]|nr:hypothetical protein [Rhodovulum sulfidophilum]